MVLTYHPRRGTDCNVTYNNINDIVGLAKLQYVSSKEFNAICCGETEAVVITEVTNHEPPTTNPDQP